MRFFIDTANVEEIRSAAAMGVLDGVTTNPSLLAKESGDPQAILKDICGIVPGPVSAEVIATDSEGMIAEGMALREIAENIVIKIPCTQNGLSAIARFKGEGVPTNATLCFSQNQALLVAKAGATYVSPFVGRLDDVGESGMELVADIVQMYQNYGMETQVLVASIRSPMHVVEAAGIGADVATIPYKVIAQLIKHPLTDIGIERFLADWKAKQGG